jgi:hypothetical protein
MATVGAYEFKPAEGARDGAIDDENKIGRGCWAWLDRTTPERRWLSIYLRCPDCGILATLWRSFGDQSSGHAIDAAGNVSPSVGCPHKPDGTPCGFHTQPTRLVGFVDRRAAPR